MLVMLVYDNQEAVPCTCREECKRVVELEVVVLKPFYQLQEELASHVKL